MHGSEAGRESIYATVLRHFDLIGSQQARDIDEPLRPFILDIGGEGRHPEAWNLNPRAGRTTARRQGEPIGRLIRARGENIPLPAESVDLVIVERTPLRPATLREIQRIAKPNSFALLRHAELPWFDPHRLALRMLPGAVRRSTWQIGGRTFLQTAIRFRPRTAHVVSQNS